ncbi:Dienelactone hydrolase [Roseateles sp. YR242]|uniref:hypothetical protein n=1 Tax=Roseateles sp. YR242 TaxID=1855305 RepID=UPI0008BC8377|nr:hypothetical protein [Roseateles sp. YR242]SEK67551.1 Dienelactone hydrolase [Roseateles sp. YR242]
MNNSPPSSPIDALKRGPLAAPVYAFVLALIVGAAPVQARVLKDQASPPPDRARETAPAAEPAIQPATQPAPRPAPVRMVESWAPDLRERIEHVQAQVQDASGRTVAGALPVTVFRPAGPGPFPLAVINHGRDWRARAHYERQRYESAARFFIRKGYAVAVPLRLGYGELASAGDPESSLNCDQPRYAPALRAAAQEINAVLRFMARQADIDASRTVLVGQSVGGFAALSALSEDAAKRPDRVDDGHGAGDGDGSSNTAAVLAVINFSGGHGGRPEVPGSPCRPDLLRQEMAQLGAEQRLQPRPVPTLWLYAENDRFFGARWPHQWAQSYRDAGGAMTWRQLPPVGLDGHRLFTDANDRWQPLVDEFLQPLGVEIPGALPYPPDTDPGRADVDDPSALPPSGPELRRLYRTFLAAPLPRAFAMNGQSRSAYASGDDAQSRALARCEEGAQAEEPCRLYAVNRTVVWSLP